MAKISIILHNIRSIYNVGAILRTAEGFGVETAIFSGYTPRFNDTNLLPHLREKLNHQISKSALGAEEMVLQEATDDILGLLHEKKQAGWTLIGLENNLLPEELPKKWLLGRAWPEDFEKICLVLGEEVQGIPFELRQELEYFLEIPMQGRKESFNVSVATGIALAALRLKLVSR